VARIAPAVGFCDACLISRYAAAGAKELTETPRSLGEVLSGAIVGFSPIDCLFVMYAMATQGEFA
jgi:hypothetical protein